MTEPMNDATTPEAPPAEGMTPVAAAAGPDGAALLVPAPEGGQRILVPVKPDQPLEFAVDPQQATISEANGDLILRFDGGEVVLEGLSAAAFADALPPMTLADGAAIDLAGLLLSLGGGQRMQPAAGDAAATQAASETSGASFSPPGEGPRMLGSLETGGTLQDTSLRSTEAPRLPMHPEDHIGEADAALPSAGTGQQPPEGIGGRSDPPPANAGPHGPDQLGGEQGLLEAPLGAGDTDPPTLAIAGGQSAEGAALLFDLTLSAPSAGPIQLDLAAGGGTATAGVDFAAAGFRYSTDGGASWIDAADGTRITIPAGATAVTVAVDTLDNAAFEGDETVSLSATLVSGDLASAAAGFGTITDAADLPHLTISGATVNEGGAATLAVTLDGATDVGISVDYATADGTARAADGDYDAIGGTLVFGPGQATTQSIAVAAKADSIDDAGETFTVQLGNATNAIVDHGGATVSVNQAPQLGAASGTVHAQHTAGDVETGRLDVGDYLLDDNVEGKAIDPDLVNGVDPARILVSRASDVTVEFVREGAGYHNMVGTYVFDDAGKIDPQSIKFIWTDATATKENHNGAALIAKDFLNNNQPEAVSIGTLPAGSHVGFFLVADGASNAANQEALQHAAGWTANAKGKLVEAGGQNDYDSDLAAINGKTGFSIDQHGNGVISVGGVALQGNVYFSHDRTLNSDADKHDIEHSLSGASASDPGKLYIGFEDLAGGGDRDYNDVVLKLDVGQYDANKAAGANWNPDFSVVDGDSAHLQSVTITTAGFHDGDLVNLIAIDGLTVGPDTDSSDDYAIAIAGDRPASEYDALLQGLFFTSSDDPVEGQRTITLTATDDHGATNSVTAKFDLVVDNELSVADGGGVRAGAGDDRIHLNHHGFKAVDGGDGHDTILVDRTLSLDGSDAAKISNVEALDFTGHGKVAATLSFADVLTMTGDDKVLEIHGDAGDKVTLVGDGAGGGHWDTAGGTGEHAGATIYTWSDPANQVTVAIDNMVTQAIIRN